MKAIKAFFLSRLMREKALLLALVGIIAAVWLSNFVSRASVFSREFRQTTSVLVKQRSILDRRQSAEDAAKKAIAQFDPTKTFTESSLIAAVNQLAADAELKNTTIEALPDETTPQFVMHSIRFRITGPKDTPGFLKLRKFYLELGKKSPYIGIEQCTMGTSAATLATEFKLSAVEIVPQK
jgi:preprotein translocase subunit SecF